jgi:hypothetical protein
MTLPSLDLLHRCTPSNDMSSSSVPSSSRSFSPSATPFSSSGLTIARPPPTSPGKGWAVAESPSEMPPIVASSKSSSLSPALLPGARFRALSPDAACLSLRRFSPRFLRGQSHFSTPDSLRHKSAQNLCHAGPRGTYHCGFLFCPLLFPDLFTPGGDDNTPRRPDSLPSPTFFELAGAPPRSWSCSADCAPPSDCLGLKAGAVDPGQPLSAGILAGTATHSTMTTHRDLGRRVGRPGQLAEPTISSFASTLDLKAGNSSGLRSKIQGRVVGSGARDTTECGIPV